MMKRAEDLKVGIHQIEDVVYTVYIGKTVSLGKIHWVRVKKKRKEMGMTLMGTINRVTIVCGGKGGG